jgi:transcriptional regulator with XRE-family HTH domain
VPSSASHSQGSEAAACGAFLSDLCAKRGIHQGDLAKTIDLMWDQRSDDRHWLEHLSLATLSRILRGTYKRMTRRKKFNIIVLAALHLEWTMAGGNGQSPGQRDVEKVWDDWLDFRQEALPRPPGQSTSDALSSLYPSSSEAASRVGLSDTEQRRYENAYGDVGLSLLEAARSSDQDSALLLGVLRCIDDHPGEGEAWLSAASSLGCRQATGLLSIPTPSERKHAAVGIALEFASSLNSAPAPNGKGILLLEGAARAGSGEAARLLAAHYDEQGEAGHAERWSLAAARID